MVFFASCNKTQPDTSAEILTTDLFARACNCIPQTVFGDSDADYKAWMQFWSGYIHPPNVLLSVLFINRQLVILTKLSR